MSLICQILSIQGISTLVRTHARRGVNWILLKSCQCGLPYDFTVRDGSFTCASGYVVYRARINYHHKPSLDLTSLKANLTNFLTGQDRNARIAINGMEYLVEPGPCGLTVPYLDSPHCFNGTVAGLVEDPSSTAQSTVYISSAPQDNTVLIATVASMCAAVVLLMFSGCILFLVMKMCKRYNLHSTDC